MYTNNLLGSFFFKPFIEHLLSAHYSLVNVILICYFPEFSLFPHFLYMLQNKETEGMNVQH